MRWDLPSLKLRSAPYRLEVEGEYSLKWYASSEVRRRLNPMPLDLPRPAREILSDVSMPRNVDDALAREYCLAVSQVKGNDEGEDGEEVVIAVL
mmetsp:Transcript_11119/g.15448  ORF Transcript_11119/g.15448 Transcript_11119/m.15448 type:complete len:94 (+) Transcript_11119:141-422(+)